MREKGYKSISQLDKLIIEKVYQKGKFIDNKISTLSDTMEQFYMERKVKLPLFTFLDDKSFQHNYQ